MSDNNFFDKMTKELKTLAQYKQFAEAQHSTILDLSKKIQELEKKIKELPSSGESITKIIHTDLNISSEELICLTQLSLLKESSEGRELTLEEAKKVDIYSKILNQIKGNKKEPKDIFNNLKDEELLKLVENNE